MRKKILSLFCALLLIAGTIPTSFALEGEAVSAADTLSALHLVNGYSGGGYSQNDTAT